MPFIFQRGLPLFEGMRIFSHQEKPVRIGMLGSQQVDLEVKDGDLIVMGGTCQRTHKHAIPPSAKSCGRDLEMKETLRFGGIHFCNILQLLLLDFSLTIFHHELLSLQTLQSQQKEIHQKKSNMGPPVCVKAWVNSLIQLPK